MNSSSDPYKGDDDTADSLPDVHYSPLKSGQKGVAIGPEELFLSVDRDGEKWSFRLLDLLDEPGILTSWITLKDPEHLLTSNRAKPLRDWVARWHHENVGRILDQVIREIQCQADEWPVEKEAPDREASRSARNRASSRRRSRDKDSKTVVHIPGGLLEEKAYEQVQAKGEPVAAYVVYNRETGEIRLEESVEVSEDVFHVPLERSLWPLPGKPEEYGDEAALCQELRRFIKDHLIVSDSGLYDVMTCFILACWRREQFTFATYLFYLGPPESGKTRALELLQRLCYRPYRVTTPTPAVVFRILDLWGVTFLMDEMDKIPRETMRELAAIIDEGYKRHGYVPRAEPSEESGYIIRNFKVYGFKALAAITEPTATVASRCILFPMMKNPEPVPLFIDEERAQDLRSKLLMYRFRHLTNQPENPDFTGWKSSRLAEIFSPLLKVAPTTEVEAALREAAKRIMFTREEEEKASIEAAVLSAFLTARKGPEANRVSTRAVAEEYNQGLPEREQKKTAWIGRRLKAMGFEKTRMPQYPYRGGWFYDDALISRLKVRYQLFEGAEEAEGHTPAEGSEGSEPSGKEPKISPVPEPSEGSEGYAEVYPSVLRPFILTKENVQAVLDEIVRLQERLVYATREMLRHKFQGRIPEENLDKILAVLEKEGRIFQPKPGCWKTV